MTQPGSTLLDAARSYTARGYRVVPIPVRSKAPVLTAWQSLRLTEAELPQHFNCVGNIGLLLGEPSGWLVDVDLDCPEAIELAPRFLPPTLAVSGRLGAPHSHWWYICEGATTKKHHFPGAKRMIVEIRSTGAQTVVGPSIHPCGETYDWLTGEPASVTHETLRGAVDALVAAVVERTGASPAAPPQIHAPTPFVSEDAVLRRAAAYLDAMPPAISGQGGHSTTFAAATAMVHGFCLDRDAALQLLIERYNPRCEPPWSEKELRHKVEDAATKPHDRPRGWLRDSKSPTDHNDVDLAGILGSTEEPSALAPASGAPSDPGPLPDHLLDVPGLIGEVVEFNRATAPRWQPWLALAAALCLQAVLAGRKVRDERGNRTNLYVVCLAGSGSGKDNPRKINTRTLYLAGAPELDGQGELASDAGLVAAVEAQPSILFQIDEFGRFLRTIGDPRRSPHLFNIVSTLMKLYSSAHGIFKGKAYADPRRNKIVDQPCVSLLATTASAHFRESLTPEAMSDGFMARLLIFESEDMPPRRWLADLNPPESIVSAARWWHEFSPGGNLSGEHPQPILVPTTDEARAIFDALAARADQEMLEPREDVRSIWARVEEKACRLALLYACSRDREKPVVDESAALWACELSEHMSRRVLFLAHQFVSHSEFDARQKAVVRAMRAAGGRMTRSQLCRATQHLSKREREEVIDNLLETERVAEIIEKTTGRSRTVYVLTE